VLFYVGRAIVIGVTLPRFRTIFKLKKYLISSITGLFWCHSHQCLFILSSSSIIAVRALMPIKQINTKKKFGNSSKWKLEAGDITKCFE
jgi:hypothetical protein